ncbi:MAG: hypothetical protein ACM3SM_09805 [Bacteroidota bacterium]
MTLNYINRILMCAACVCLLSMSSNSEVSAQENVTDKFKFTFSNRLRIETWDNSVTLSKSANAGTSYLRNRISLGGQWMPDEIFELNVRLSHEFRKYLAPAQSDFHMNEIFIDQLNMKLKTGPYIDGVLTVGRQNINLGEGFIVMDGSPLDGSRSAYFNAVRYDWNMNKTNSLSLFYTYQPVTDKLPVINGNDIDASAQGDGSWKLLEQTEAGGGLYYTGVFSNLNIQSYYVRKDYLEPDAQKGQHEYGLNTIGSRVNFTPAKPVSLTLEAAYQAGGMNTKAYGGYFYTDYRPSCDHVCPLNTITAGTIFLSGDDPATSGNEGWDPVFSRWPKWSETYVNTLIKEFGGRPAYWSNLISLYGSMKFKFDEQFRFSFDYHHMFSQYAGKGNGFIGGTGKSRGDLFIGKLMYTANKSVSGTIIIEHFIPGNYYSENASSSTWARMEMNYTL